MRAPHGQKEEFKMKLEKKKTAMNSHSEIIFLLDITYNWNA